MNAFSFFYAPRLAGAAALLCVLLPGLAAAGQVAMPTDIQVQPAQRVAHATQAQILGSARADARLVAVGDHGVVLLSDDEGRSFRQAKQVPADLTLTAVSFVGAHEGWAVGHGGVVLHTADGGGTWTLQRSDLAQDRPLFAVHFLDAKHGVAVGLWSLVLRTEDGGAHWQSITVDAAPGAKKADLNLLGLFADTQGRIYATGERGMLLRSDDAGQHWSYLSTGYKGTLWAGLATSKGTLLAAGLRGSLYRSTDAGASWSRIDTHSQSSITALVAVGSGIVGVGLDGLVLRSQDDGASFQNEVRPDHASLTSVLANASGQPVWFSRQGVLPLVEQSAATAPSKP